MKGLTVSDIIGLIVCWAGVIGFNWVLLSNGYKDDFIILISLCGGCYLSKWIIMQRRSTEHDSGDDS